MDILVIWPPHVPSYFNAGHHTPVFLTAQYLRRADSGRRVTALDWGVLDTTWKDVGDRLYQLEPDVVVVINDFDNIDNLSRLITYCRQLAPGCRVITGGRLSVQAPLVFRHFDLDAVVVGGDLEAAVDAYCRSVALGDAGPIPSVAVRADGTWVEPAPGTLTLDPDEWEMPDVNEIPFASYDAMYRRESNKFDGIPERRALVVPAARGCPVNCSFCDVPSVQGLRDRRLSAKDTVDYIRDAEQQVAFDYVSFYAPTFTLNRRWVVELCERLHASGPVIPWKCATAIPYLDSELVGLMAAAGCIRISVGLETLEPSALPVLPRRKRAEITRFAELNDIASAAGVDMNYFVIVGLPGTSLYGTRRTFAAIEEAGARARPTIYSSMDRLRDTSDPSDLWLFNRQLLDLSEVDAKESSDWYGFMFGAGSDKCRTAERIPARGGRV